MVGLLLGQRRRRYANLKPALGQRLLSTGRGTFREPNYNETLMYIVRIARALHLCIQ